MNRVAKTGIDDINAAYEKFLGLYSKFELLLSKSPQQTSPLEQVPARVVSHPESGRVNPLTQSNLSQNKSVDKYSQSINVLAAQSTMAVKYSAKEIKEATDIHDKINYIIQQNSQWGSEGISASISSLNLSIEKSYQMLEQLKKEVNSSIKEQPNQDVLNHLNTLTSTIHTEKTNIIESKKTLLSILVSLFELPPLAMNSLQKKNLFSNQKHVAPKEIEEKIKHLQKYSNDLNNQFIKYKNEAESIRGKFNLLWKNKEENSDELVDNIKSLVVLKNEKTIQLPQQIKESLDPLWNLAINSHADLIKEIDNRLQETLEKTERDELTYLKNDSEQKFMVMANLQQEYQRNMSNNKLLSEEFSKKKKEVNARLGQIMLEIHTFSEHQEKQLKKLNG